MNLFVAYVMAAGGMTAGMQVLRGAIRGAGKLIDGQPRMAIAEVVDAVLAPVVSGVNQLYKLGEDVWHTAGLLARQKGHDATGVADQTQVANQWPSPSASEPKLKCR